MKENHPLVVVLSRNYSTGLGVVRALGAAGYTVDLVVSSREAGNAEIVAKSKYVRNAVEVVSKQPAESGDHSELVAKLLAYAGAARKPVLIPTDDFTTVVMENNRAALAEHFLMPSIVVGDDPSLQRYLDRDLQTELAQDAGLRTRQKWVLSLADEEPEFPEEIFYPCKCRYETIDGTFSNKFEICSDLDELTTYFYKRRRQHPDRTIQVAEYYEEDVQIDVSGVCLDQQVIIPGAIEKLQTAEHDQGAPQLCRVASVDILGDAKEKLANMLRQLHYVGLFDAKMYMVDGKVFFKHLILRCGRNNYAVCKCGVNLPALLVAYMADGTKADESKLKLNADKTFIHEKGIWEDYAHGYMTDAEVQHLMSSTDFTILCDYDDPEPGKFFMASMSDVAAKARHKKTTRRIKNALKKALAPSLRKLKHWLLGYPQTKKKNQRNRFTAKPRVVVAGRNYCSNLCLSRAFGRAGYEVEVLRIFQAKPKWQQVMKWIKPDAYSKYVKAYHVCVTRKKDSRILKKLKAIADRNRKMLLIPADDLVASVVDDHYNMLSKYYLLPNVNRKQGEINRLMGKAIQKELAEAAGLPIINSCVIATENGQFEIPESVKYPCFIKPNISKNGLKTRMKRCDNKEELAGYLTEFSRKKDIEMLCQDFVEIGKEYSILGVSTRDGVIGPGYFGAEEGGHDGRKGVALTGIVVDTAQRQQLIDDIMAFIGTLNFEGLFDVDLIETVDGKMYFVELNMRFGGSGFSITDSGVNLPGMFADYMILHKPVDLNTKLENPGKRFVSEKIMLEEYCGGYLSIGKMRSLMKESDIHFIKADEDKKPYRHFRRYYFFALLNRVFNKVKKSGH